MDDLPDQKVSSPMPSSVTINKEREGGVGGSEVLRPAEKVPVVEAGKMAETAAEKESHVTRVEPPELTEPIKERGEILVAPVAPPTPIIILPLSAQEYFNPKNWHRPVSEAIRWLLEQTRKIIKSRPGTTVFRKS